MAPDKALSTMIAHMYTNRTRFIKENVKYTGHSIGYASGFTYAKNAIVGKQPEEQVREIEVVDAPENDIDPWLRDDDEFDGAPIVKLDESTLPVPNLPKKAEEVRRHLARPKAVQLLPVASEPYWRHR
jgi:hypothetical protein